MLSRRINFYKYFIKVNSTENLISLLSVLERPTFVLMAAQSALKIKGDRLWYNHQRPARDQGRCIRWRCKRFEHVCVSENEMTLVEARTTNVKLNSSMKVRVPEANLSRRLTTVRCFHYNFVTWSRIRQDRLG